MRYEEQNLNYTDFYNNKFYAVIIRNTQGCIMKKPILLVAFSCLLFACSPQKTAVEYQQAGEQFYADKKYDEAIIEFKNAVKNDIENSQTRFLLAQSYLRSGNIEGAKKEYQRALDLGFDANLILPMLIRADLLMTNRAQVIETLSTPLQLEVATQVEMTAIAGIGLTYLGDFKLGMETLAKTLSFDLPDNFYYKLAKAWVAGNQDQKEEAITLAKTLYENDSEFDDAQLLLANLYAINSNYDQSKELLETYINKHNNNFLVRFIYISILIKSDKIEDAEREVNILLKTFPDLAIANEFKAEVLLRKGSYKEAAEYASIALTNQPNLFKSNLIAGLGNYRDGNSEMAYHHLVKIEQRLPPEHFGSQILAMVKLKLGYTEDAVASINALDNISEAEFALLSNASLALIRNGESAQAAEFIRKMDDIETNDAKTLSKRGVFKLSINDQEGLTDLLRAIELDPSYEAPRLALLYHYIKRDQLRLAMDVANDWVKNFPDKDSGYLAQGTVFGKQKNHAKARLAFEKALEVNPKSPGALYNLAQFERADKNFEGSFEFLQLLLADNPSHTGALDILIKISSSLDDKNQVSNYLTSMSGQHPDVLLLPIAHAKITELSGDINGALNELRELEPKAKNDAAFLKAYNQIAFLAKDYLLSEKLAKQRVELSPNSYQAHIGLLHSLEGQKKYQQAFTEVKRAQAIFPTKEDLKLYEVNYLMHNKSFERAKIELEGINQSQVNRTVYLGISAQFYAKTGEFEQAKVLAEELYRLKPTMVNSTLYMQILQHLKENQKALDVVKYMQEKFGESKAIDAKIAELNIQLKPEVSLKYYQELAEKEPDNFIILNNLAWTAILSNNYQLGLESATKAAELAPQQPQVLDTLAVAHMKMGHYQQAETILVDVIKKLPEDQDVMLHYAEVLIHLNKLDESEVFLSTIDDSQNKKAVIDLLMGKKG